MINSLAAEPVVDASVLNGLDYGYMALVVAVLIIFGGVWVYAGKKLSNFNTENSRKKKDTQDELNRNIYKAGTAPLVLAVGNYVSEQVIGDFEEEEQEIIRRYEEARTARIDSENAEFIDLSSFAEIIEYDQKVEDLIDAHSAIDTHNESYDSLKRNLRNVSIAIWLPIVILLVSAALHFVGFLFFGNSKQFNYLVQVTFVLSVVASVPSLVFYVKYTKCVKRLDNAGVVV